MLEESIAKIPSCVKHNMAAMCLAHCYERQREFAKALEAYRQQLAATPDDAGAMARLALLQSSAPEDSLRDGKAAMELAERAHRSPNRAAVDWQVPLALASAHANLGNFDKATIAIDEALTITKEEAVVTFLQKVRQEFSDQKPFRQ